LANIYQSSHQWRRIAISIRLITDDFGAIQRDVWFEELCVLGEGPGVFQDDIWVFIDVLTR